MPDVTAVLAHAGLSATAEAVIFGIAALAILALFVNDRRRRKPDA